MHSLGYVHPIVFAWYREIGEMMGFRRVEAGPLCRSSYHAEQAWAAAAVDSFFPRGTRRSLPIND
jgi:lipoic acid synthetase